MHPYLEKIIPKEDREAAEKRIPKTFDQFETAVKTNISVADMNLLRVFLDANDMTSVEIGYWIDYNDAQYANLSGQYGVNRLCYSLTKTEFIIDSNIMYMKIKFGSLENAFNEFKKEYYNRARAL